MVKAKVYLKSGQCFDVAAEKVVCKYNTIFDVGDWNFCPNCGAMMDGGADK